MFNRNRPKCVEIFNQTCSNVRDSFFCRGLNVSKPSTVTCFSMRGQIHCKCNACTKKCICEEYRITIYLRAGEAPFDDFDHTPPICQSAKLARLCSRDQPLPKKEKRSEESPYHRCQLFVLCIVNYVELKYTYLLRHLIVNHFGLFLKTFDRRKNISFLTAAAICNEIEEINHNFVVRLSFSNYVLKDLRHQVLPYLDKPPGILVLVPNHSI